MSDPYEEPFNPEIVVEPIVKASRTVSTRSSLASKTRISSHAALGPIAPHGGQTRQSFGDRAKRDALFGPAKSLPRVRLDDRSARSDVESCIPLTRSRRYFGFSFSERP